MVELSTTPVIPNPGCWSEPSGELCKNTDSWAQAWGILIQSSGASSENHIKKKISLMHSQLEGTMPTVAIRDGMRMGENRPGEKW